MGYLGNLDRIKTLELFLTDKGKELMLKENGMGLHDLISQFSLDDRDYDYRRTSNVWVDGISPVPDGSLLPYGTTQFGINNGGVLSDVDFNNDCRPSEDTNTTPFSENCWYDMPDVRGDRGNLILNCYGDTGHTQGIKSCTNVYAFYDVTSVEKSDADAAKIGLNDWFAGVTASTPNYSGKLFHIAVFGERWINTSWYPWNGKLDTWDWTPCGNGITDIASPFWDYCKSPYTPNGPGNSSTFLGPITGPAGAGIPEYRTPVTGLYLQADLANNLNTYGFSTGDWTGFNVLPPNTIRGGLTTNGTGGRAEFWTTGCTLVDSRAPGYDYDETAAGITPTPIGFTASTSSSGDVTYTFDSNSFSFSPTFSAYTPNDFTITTTSGIPTQGSKNNLFGNLPINSCEDNCCPSNYPELGYTGPGLFGCQDCSPYDNTITNGFVYKFENNNTNWVFTDADLGISGGTMDLVISESISDCVKYRGMDRNVLIVDIFDETQGGERYNNPSSASAGGILPLGRKEYYNGEGNAAVTNITTLGNLGGELTLPLYSGWGDVDNTGYHGGSGRVSTQSGLVPTNSPSSWNISGNDMPPPRLNQPTEDWKYSQDLFLKTHSLYENFAGFVYPVVPLESPTGDTVNSKTVFPLHLYGAIYGNVVPVSEFVDNPTVVAVGGTLIECTVTNPYDALIPITYNANGVTQMNLNSDYNFEPFESSEFTLFDTITPLAPYVKGMRNWGWDFNPTVGCSSLPCVVSDIFSGGTFSADLNSFITGSSSFNTVVTTACTECQCLPAVFINKQGPILVIEDEDEGCLCPDGTYSKECCEENPTTPDDPIFGICGPIPQKGPIVGGANNINQDGGIILPPKVPNFTSPGIQVPKSSNLVDRREAQYDRNVKTTEPPLNTKSLSGYYSSKYSIDFDIYLNQFLEDDGKVNWDVKFSSTSQYGSKILEEGDGAEFYWVIGPGYRKTKRNPKLTQACKSPSYSLIKENKNSYKGVNVGFLKGYWSETPGNMESYMSEYRGEVSYEFCVTMVYKYLGKVLKKTKRFSISGTNAGYRINIKT